MKIRDFIVEQLINKEASVVAKTIIDEINKKLDRLKEDIFVATDIEEVKQIKAQYDELDKLLKSVDSKPLEVDLDEVVSKLNSQVLIAKITNALNQSQSQTTAHNLVEHLKNKGLVAKENLEKLFDKE